MAASHRFSFLSLGLGHVVADRAADHRAGDPMVLGRYDRAYGGARERLHPIPGQPPSLLDPPPGCPFAPRCPYVMDRCKQEMPPLDPAGAEPGHLSACWLPHDSAARAEVRQRVLQAAPAGSAGA